MNPDTYGRHAARAGASGIAFWMALMNRRAEYGIKRQPIGRSAHRAAR